MSDKPKDGHGLDKVSRLEQNRSDKEEPEKHDDLLEPPFPFKAIPFPESFDT